MDLKLIVFDGKEEKKQESFSQILSALSNESFQLNSFRFVSFPKIEAIDAVNLDILLDCIGHVVGKKDARQMLTKSGQESKCMTLYLEDLQ
ncbi:hypothetical protein AHAS_Ahas20G0274700 [Arachis hypogaea]